MPQCAALDIILLDVALYPEDKDKRVIENTSWLLKSQPSNVVSQISGSRLCQPFTQFIHLYKIWVGILNYVTNYRARYLLREGQLMVGGTAFMVVEKIVKFWEC